MNAGRVIVGVDGSEPSKRALRWAADYAAARNALLEAIAVWEMPATYGWVSTLEEVDPVKSALAGLDSVILEVLGEGSGIDTTVEKGHASHVLVKASERADLLVVGSRGRGAVRGMLLGSVSLYCVQHAHCPVVVFRSATN